LWVFAGTHQFLVLVPEHPENFPRCRDLGNGQRGIVVGAHNRVSLKVEWFEPSDWQAVREYVNPAGYVRDDWPDFDTQVERADTSAAGKRIDAVIADVLAAVEANERHGRVHPRQYPSFRGQFAPGCINSNSWAQSAVEAVLGPGRVREDFRGADNCHQNRIPASEFRP
jgi:hypothetical protein